MNQFMTALEKWLFDPTVAKVIAVVVGVLVVVTLARVTRRSLLKRVESPDARYRIRKLVNFFATVVAFILVTVVFGDRLGSLTVAFGVAGAGIAFALQEVIASIAGWAAVSLAGFYSVGHRVQLGGITGDVIDIGILRTTIMETGGWVKGDQYNGRIVRVANSFVFKEPVFNYSGDFPFLWDEVSVPIRYGSDRRLAREILLKAANETVGALVPQARETWREMVAKYRIEEALVEPTVLLVANDNWMEFTIRYVVDYKRRRSTKDALFERVLDLIDAAGSKVTLASATFELVGNPTVDVRLEGKGAPGA